MTIKFHKTQRGFRKGEFVDRYGAKCYIQKSSLVSEDAIWLGVADANSQIMVSDAVKLGLVKVENPCGWMKYEIPNEVMVNTSMHLTQRDAKALIKILQKFVETGKI